MGNIAGPGRPSEWRTEDMVLGRSMVVVRVPAAFKIPAFDVRRACKEVDKSLENVNYEY